MRYAIFVDGPNMNGSIEKLGLKIDNYQTFFLHVLENSAAILNSSFIGQHTPPSQLWRVFWYQVGYMDELRLDDARLQENLRAGFESSGDLLHSYLAIAERENPGTSSRELREIAWNVCFQEGKEWYQNRKTAIEGMRRFNHSVMANTNFVEIIESGHWKVDMLRKQVNEKGIDTSLAVDMVTLINHYDVAILLSGDADMIPSLNYAKQRGKHVAVVDLIKGNPPEHHGRHSATRLKSAADFVVPIYEMNLVSKGIAKHKLILKKLQPI